MRMVSPRLSFAVSSIGGERGEADKAERGRLEMAQVFRLLGDQRRLDGDLLRIGAFLALVAYAEHSVADVQIGDALAQRADRAGKIAAENVRELVQRVAPAAAAHLRVGAVDAGRIDVDHHFARSRLGVRRVAIAKHFRSAVAGQQHGFHRRPPLVRDNTIAPRTCSASAVPPDSPFSKSSPAWPMVLVTCARQSTALPRARANA